MAKNMWYEYNIEDLKEKIENYQDNNRKKDWSKKTIREIFMNDFWFDWCPYFTMQKRWRMSKSTLKKLIRAKIYPIMN